MKENGYVNISLLLLWPRLPLWKVMLRFTAQESFSDADRDWNM